MLFDLRSRGRRRTVQAVYLGLAILIGGGLVLFGVGTGSGSGGLLNAFGNGGSSNAQNQAVTAQVKAARKQTVADPTSSAAWANLVNAEWAGASSTSSTTGAYTAAGKQDLAGVTSAWQHYVNLVKTPNANLAVLAARSYAALGDYAQESSAWAAEAATAPTEAKGYECEAISAYAAKQNRVGALAANKAASLLPKANRKTLISEIEQAKTQPSLAQTC